jgi:hypothetical protein
MEANVSLGHGTAGTLAVSLTTAPEVLRQSSDRGVQSGPVTKPRRLRRSAPANARKVDRTTLLTGLVWATGGLNDEANSRSGPTNYLWSASYRLPV